MDYFFTKEISIYFIIIFLKNNMMVKCLLFLLFIPTLIHAQKIALIDRTFKTPILYTDSVTMEQLDKGYYPIYASDLDSVAKTLTWLKELVTTRKRSKANSYEFKTGKSIITAQTLQMAYGDRYIITLKTNIDPVTASYRLNNEKVPNKKAVELIDRLIKYIDDNVSILKPVRSS